MELLIALLFGVVQGATEFMPISARFIANKASYQFKKAEIDAITKCLGEVGK